MGLREVRVMIRTTLIICAFAAGYYLGGHEKHDAAFTAEAVQLAYKMGQQDLILEVIE